MKRKVLFIHQNAPGQFFHLINRLARDSGYIVTIIGERRRLTANVGRLPKNIRIHAYAIDDIDDGVLPIELKTTFRAMRRGRAVTLCMENLRLSGMTPDVVYGHPGWGEMIHVSDIFPLARVITYAEFYFNSSGQDLDFDPEFQRDPIDPLRVRTDNMQQLVSMASAASSISPTRWQKSRFPAALQASMHVIHDGVDELLQPNHAADVPIPGMRLVLTRSTPVVTYVARNLEPYRGFPTFMRSLPYIQRQIPDAQVVIVGGDQVSYSPAPSGRLSYRELMLNELEGELDTDKVHFLGRVPYRTFLSVLQLSRAHVYLTYPFVLSWSLMEAMAVGATVIASATSPVREIIDDGVNGRLVDFFNVEEVADAVIKSLTDRDSRRLGHAAMRTIKEGYLRSDCVSRQLSVLFPDEV